MGVFFCGGGGRIVETGLIVSCYKELETGERGEVLGWELMSHLVSHVVCCSFIVFLHTLNSGCLPSTKDNAFDSVE